MDGLWWSRGDGQVSSATDRDGVGGMVTMEDDDPVTALVRAVEELRAQRDEDRALIEELQIALASPGRRVPRMTVYPDWVSWVDQWLSVRVSRRPQRVRWCHRYAEHPEVADRLEALWHAWEALWPESEARLGWFRDGLDHQLGVITADDGPLRECSAFEGQHVQAVALSSALPKTFEVVSCMPVNGVGG